MKRSNKPAPRVEIISYGRYSGWENASKELPHLQDLTDKVKAEIDIEFGMTVRIYQGKGRFLNYRIEHPPFRDAEGQVTPDFTGEYQVRTNPADFFLGDSIREPLDDKKGKWRFMVFFDDQLVAEKTIELT